MQFKPWTEAREQYQLVLWLDIFKYTFTMICNDTRTPSYKQKTKNKELWLRPWMSDLIIILKRGNVLFLELKKARGPRWWLNNSKIGEHQLKWQESINNCPWVQYSFAHWYEEAIELIERLELTK